MDYNTFGMTEFIPRVEAMLQSILNAIVTAGADPNFVTWSQVDSVDLRYTFSATHHNRTGTINIELTDSLRLGASQGEGKAVISLWANGGDHEIAHGYDIGTPVSYVDAAGIDVLLGKLAELESQKATLIMKLRGYLEV